MELNLQIKNEIGNITEFKRIIDENNKSLIELLNFIDTRVDNYTQKVVIQSQTPRQWLEQLNYLDLFIKKNLNRDIGEQYNSILTTHTRIIELILKLNQHIDDTKNIITIGQSYINNFIKIDELYNLHDIQNQIVLNYIEYIKKFKIEKIDVLMNQISVLSNIKELCENINNIIKSRLPDVERHIISILFEQPESQDQWIDQLKQQFSEIERNYFTILDDTSDEYIIQQYDMMQSSYISDDEIYTTYSQQFNELDINSPIALKAYMIWIEQQLHFAQSQKLLLVQSMEVSSGTEETKGGDSLLSHNKKYKEKYTVKYSI